MRICPCQLDIFPARCFVNEGLEVHSREASDRLWLPKVFEWYTTKVYIAAANGSNSCFLQICAQNSYLSEV